MPSFSLLFSATEKYWKKISSFLSSYSSFLLDPIIIVFYRFIVRLYRTINLDTKKCQNPLAQSLLFFLLLPLALEIAKSTRS